LSIEGRREGNGSPTDKKEREKKGPGGSNLYLNLLFSKSFLPSSQMERRESCGSHPFQAKEERRDAAERSFTLGKTREERVGKWFESSSTPTKKRKEESTIY